ncbi:MAG: hypothetical protein IPM53_12785 [Anaerolineaceae bacterium]|nr:hypothetical protein [Anaerolineaceae bacterium]
MKYIPPMFAFLALLLVLALPHQSAQGAADKISALPAEPNVVPLAVTSTPTPIATATIPATAVPTTTPQPPPDPGLACLRINFEVSGDVAQAGTYEVREVGGRHLVSWMAKDGWQDSGWLADVEISFSAVYVQVFFTPEGGDPVAMAIMNPAPGTTYGWVARGMCHAVEVGWP